MLFWKTKVGYALAIGNYRLFFRNYSSGFSIDNYADLTDYNFLFVTLRIK